MRLLLDTQYAIWWLISGKSISTDIQQFVQNAEAVFISRASLWEMAIKISLGKLNIDLSLFVREAEASGFQWLDIKNEHILKLATLTVYEDHKDPFDRLLIAQSLYEPMIFVTADAKLGRYGNQIKTV